MLIALEKDFELVVTGSIQMVPGIGDRLLVGATVHTAAAAAAAGGMSQMAMGYNFYFFNFIIMTSSCHMSTQIQIPNYKVDIIFYPPISCLQK